MVLPLRPSKFYGRSLPRPRVYSDVKFNSERVDPPMGVNASLLSWAKDAHWSMGGLSFEKKRMAGKIEGSRKRLRDEHENSNSNQIKAAKKSKLLQEEGEKESNGTELQEGFERSKTEGEPNEDLKTPQSKVLSSSKLKVFSSPRPAQIFKPKWATDRENEDSPLVVPDSIKRLSKKCSPKVQLRARNLGVSSERVSKGFRFTKGVSSTDEKKRSKAHSVVQNALKRLDMGITEVYDYVPVPDKIFKRVSPRRKQEDKEGADSGSLAGFEPRSPDSTEHSIRRSSRVLSYSPGPFSRGIKRVILPPK